MGMQLEGGSVNVSFLCPVCSAVISMQGNDQANFLAHDKINASRTHEIYQSHLELNSNGR